MTPSRQRGSFSPSARKANTTSRGRATTVLCVASGINLEARDQPLELVEPAVPAHAVGRGPVAGGELGVDQVELGLLALLADLHGDERLCSVGCRAGFP